MCTERQIPWTHPQQERRSFARGAGQGFLSRALSRHQRRGQARGPADHPGSKRRALQVARLFPGRGWLVVEDALSGLGKE